MLICSVELSNYPKNHSSEFFNKSKQEIHKIRLFLKLFSLFFGPVSQKFQVFQWKILYPGSAPGWPYTPQKRFIGQKICLKILLTFSLTFARPPANRRNPIFTMGTQLFGWDKWFLRRWTTEEVFFSKVDLSLTPPPLSWVFEPQICKSKWPIFTP